MPTLKEIINVSEKCVLTQQDIGILSFFLMMDRKRRDILYSDFSFSTTNATVHFRGKENIVNAC